MTKSRAKADGQDPVQFEVTVTNIKAERPAENISVGILVNGEKPTSHNIKCTLTDSSGKSKCEATSELWSMVYLEPDLGELQLIKSYLTASAVSEGPLYETPERKEALFYDIFSYMHEAQPGSLVAYADSPLSYISVSIVILDSNNNPIVGMNPIIEIEGPGANNYVCEPSDENGVAVCKIHSEVPGTYILTSVTPRLADPMSLTFVSRTRSCNAIPHANAYEVWGENDTADWGPCVVSGCHLNYSMNPSGECVADVRVCDPYPTGAANATQAWEAVTAGEWGRCAITSCALNYTMSGTGMGNSCVANTRPVDPGSLPPNADLAEETWNGEDWDPPYATSCRYPYKAVDGSCAPLDILPDAFVILDLVYQNLNEVVYSSPITVTGVESFIQAGINGDPGSFIEKKFSGETDWLPFNPLTDVLRNGDQFRLGVVTANQIGVTSTLSYTLGAMGPLTWNVTTRDSNPPSEFHVSHSNNQREFFVGWNTAGASNSPNTCAIEFQKNATTWTSAASGLDCDSPLAIRSVHLPTTAGFSTYFNSSGIPLRIRRSDGVVVANLTQKLRCFEDPYVPAVDDPDRDENCNGIWNDDGDVNPPDTTPLAGFFSIVEASPVTRPLITLSITCPIDLESSPVLVAYSETSPPTNWEPCTWSKTLILGGSGLRKVYVRFKDTNDNMTSIQSQSITYDSSQASAEGSFVINGGRAFTQDEAVTLNIFCPTELDSGSIGMALGVATSPGDPDIAEDWSPCVSTVPYSLSTGEGTKNIYMRFIGDEGTVTDTVSTSIVLDKTAPTASISYFDGWKADASIAVNVTAFDAESGLESCELQIAQAALADGVVGPFTAWSTVSTSCSSYHTNGVSGAAYKFRVRATDKAGSVSPWLEPASIVKINMEAPYGGSINYSNSLQATTPIVVNVNRGLDTYSGMSTAASDYLLQVSAAILDPVALSCGAYGAFVNTGLTGVPTATQYTFSGSQGYCYKFRYQVRNKVGISQTYTSTDVTKINFTYAWNVGAYGACNGGTGTWEYGNWGACTGGTGVWVYSGWSGCSASCGGGAQSRSASCSVNANTGVEIRSATCRKTSLSGVQTRTVVCQRSNGATVDDGFCIGNKAVTQQSCTPTSDGVCGSVTTSRSCTNYSNSVCGSQAALVQSCNIQLCCASSGISNLCPGITYNTCGGSCTSTTISCASGSVTTVSTSTCYSGGKFGNYTIYNVCRCN